MNAVDLNSKLTSDNFIVAPFNRQAMNRDGIMNKAAKVRKGQADGDHRNDADEKSFVHLLLHTHYSDGKKESLYFPGYDASVGTDAFTHLVSLGKAGLKKHYGLDYDNPETNAHRELIKRFDYEVGIIAKKGFVNHFLVVADIIQWARGNAVPIGPGCGPVAGSLVAYLLDITQVDPVTFNLIFERFINPERDCPPSLGIEFCETRCECVTQYVKRKHGREPCARIVTTEEPETKRVIRNISRALDVAFEEISPIEINMFGQKALTVLKKAVDLVRQVHGVDIDLEAIPLDDPVAFELLQGADTEGIFMLDSAGVRELIADLRPVCIEEIAVVLSLSHFWPDLMDYFDDFFKRRKGLEKIRYDHPLLESILKDTYGIPVYQEQIQRSIQVLAGYSLGRADILRRAMGKKKVEEMTKEIILFAEGCRKHLGLDAEKAGEIFDSLERFAGLAFNKAHAISHAVLVCRTAYVKAHYPVEFCKARTAGSMA